MAIYTPLIVWSNTAVLQLLSKLDTGKIPSDTITNDHVDRSEQLQTIADFYAKHYRGDGSFMQSIQGQVLAGRVLSTAQRRGALNCMFAEYKANKAEINLIVSGAQQPSNPPQKLSQPSEALKPAVTPTVVSGPVVVVPVVLDGTYTIVLNDRGDYRTIKIATVPAEKRSATLPEGAQFVGYLSGPNNDADYTGCGYLFGSDVKLSAKFKPDTQLAQALKVLTGANRDEQMDYGQAYAIASGHCWRCGRKLTVPASLHRGMGPVCAEKI